MIPVKFKERETKGYQVLDIITIKCPNCNINLLQITKVKESSKRNSIKVICPRCQEESFVVKTQGEIFMGGLNTDIIDVDTKPTEWGYESIIKVKLNE